MLAALAAWALDTEARHKTLAVQAGIDDLAANFEAAQAQLGANNVFAQAALAGAATAVNSVDVQVAFETGSDALREAFFVKQAQLEAELVAADAAFEKAIGATATLREAAVVLNDAALMRHAPALLKRFATARAAVAAIPELPVTRSFLLVVPAPDLPALRMDALDLLALALVWEASPPVILTCAQAVQLQAWLPPGGSTRPSEWDEVYRATTHGFDAAAFHARCDGKVRLLVLVRTQTGGWLFGGFTAVGFVPSTQYVSDPSAFLFSLTNSLGHPEKLQSKMEGRELLYLPSGLGSFSDGGGLAICSNANVMDFSTTYTGHAFVESASTGAHPMSKGLFGSWRAAEVVAWVV